MAGCGFATCGIQIYGYKGLQEYTKRFPEDMLEVFIDDFSLSVLRPSNREFQRAARLAAQALQATLEQEFGAIIAPAKADVIVTHPCLQEPMARLLGELAGPGKAKTQCGNCSWRLVCGRKAKARF